MGKIPYFEGNSPLRDAQNFELRALSAETLGAGVTLLGLHLEDGDLVSLEILEDLQGNLLAFNDWHSDYYVLSSLVSDEKRVDGDFGSDFLVLIINFDFVTYLYDVLLASEFDYCDHVTNVKRKLKNEKGQFRWSIIPKKRKMQFFLFRIPMRRKRV